MVVEYAKDYLFGISIAIATLILASSGLAARLGIVLADFVIKAISNVA